MTLTPREAIQRGQVWLRPFGHFCPADQGYMGFSSDEARDSVFDRMEDGALVVVWTRTTNGEAGWVGKFRGLLQLQKAKVLAVTCSSAAGNRLREESDKDFSLAIPVMRAWVANPLAKKPMKDIAPSIWPGQTQAIGHRSAQMNPIELGHLEPLRISEVSIWGQAPATSAHFEQIRDCFI